MGCSWQMEDSEGTVRQIGAFSEGINNLTVSVHRELKMLLESHKQPVCWRGVVLSSGVTCCPCVPAHVKGR